MTKHLIVLIFVTLFFVKIRTNNDNSFEATLGCLQFNAKGGYNANHPYFPTAAFKNIHTTKHNVTKMRFGILGRRDGHVRFAPTRYPFDGTMMNEIVFSGWDNTKTEIRRYKRMDYRTRIDVAVLHRQSSYGLLSEMSPMMFTMEINPKGSVKLIKDGDVHPFLQFHDPNLSFKYIGFSGWEINVAYFYDCPLEMDRRGCANFS